MTSLKRTSLCASQITWQRACIVPGFPFIFSKYVGPKQSKEPVVFLKNLHLRLYYPIMHGICIDSNDNMTSHSGVGWQQKFIHMTLKVTICA